MAYYFIDGRHRHTKMKSSYTLKSIVSLTVDMDIKIQRYAPRNILLNFLDFGIPPPPPPQKNYKLKKKKTF